ncbi:MAG: hypothetical protein ACK5LN_01170 [Propioniciclava sp.]
MSDDPASLDECVKALQKLLPNYPELIEASKDAIVEGITVNGDTASMENARIRPAEVRGYVEALSLEKINGRWYSALN